MRSHPSGYSNCRSATDADVPEFISFIVRDITPSITDSWYHVVGSSKIKCLIATLLIAVLINKNNSWINRWPDKSTPSWNQGLSFQPDAQFGTDWILHDQDGY
jgi:hypothetical protein